MKIFEQKRSRTKIANDCKARFLLLALLVYEHAIALYRSISMKKSRHCPDCGWKFPIAKINAPIDRSNGKQFNCPQCQTYLMYRTNHDKLYKISTVLIAPATLMLYHYKDIPIVKTLATFVVLPVMIVLSVMWRKGEYLERYTPK